jgi:hypothetical protein
MVFGRFVYFLTHPSEYIGLWTLDATVLFSVLTLLVVLKQLFVAQRQMDIMVRQDETNRKLLSRRVKLVMYVASSPPGRGDVLCRNDGNKTAQNFYWHLSVPADVRGIDVRDGLGVEMLNSYGVDSHENVPYRHYTGFVSKPLYPTRDTPVAWINTGNSNLPLWWSTVSEDGSDPTPDGKMQRMEGKANLNPMTGK